MRLNFIHFTLFFGISISSYAQVGIGTTEPIATLDIKNNNSSADVINITTPNNENHLKLSNSGSLDIGTGSFSPNNNPGTEEYYLVSQGPNTPPIWKQLEGNFMYNGIQIIQREYDNQSGTTNGQTIPIIFNIASKSEIIEDSGNKIAELVDNQFIKILADGFYNISWNTTASLGNADVGLDIPYGNSKLYYSNSNTDKSNYYVASASQSRCDFLFCNQFYNNTTTRVSITNKEITLELKANNYLFMDLTAYFGSASNDFKLLRASIQIKKIEI